MSRRLAASLGLAVLVAAFMLAMAAPATGANSQVFPDPVGDNEGAGTSAYAVDIVSAAVASEDGGLVTFTVTLRTPDVAGGQLFTDDAVGVFVDTDRDQSTGDQGDEVAFKVFGQDGETPRAEFCRSIEGPLSCQAMPVGDFTSVVTPPNTQVLSFSLSQANWFMIRFQVITFFSTNRDFAPGPDSTAYFDYDVRADPDKDGISGFGDSCPTRSGGRFDRDGDGCPGPYKTLPGIGISYRGLSKTSSSVRYSLFGVTGVPSGASVKVRAGGATFSRRGNGPLGRLANRSLPAGLTITITVSRPGSCTRVRVIKIKPQAANGYTNVSERDVHPAGIECT